MGNVVRALTYGSPLSDGFFQGERSPSRSDAVGALDGDPPHLANVLVTDPLGTPREVVAAN
jgi:hypothetical protein